MRGRWPRRQGGEGVGETVADGGDGKKERCQREKRFAAESVAEDSRTHRANEASNERATVGPADLCFGGEVEVTLKKRLRAADNNPVPPEEKTAHGGDDRDEPDIASVEFFRDARILGCWG